MTFPPDILRRAAAVRLLITDVDGVWTDGTVEVRDGGEESLRFCVQDGLGLKGLQAAGVEVVAVSGRDSPAFGRRARDLGLDGVIQGCLEKGRAAAGLLEARGLEPFQAAAVGDDLPDLELFERCGLAIAPANAVEAVLSRADYVTRARGGAGALREVCDLLLEARRAAAPAATPAREGRTR